MKNKHAQILENFHQERTEKERQPRATLNLASNK